jgi:ABC-2 type transport system permease protein
VSTGTISDTEAAAVTRRRKRRPLSVAYLGLDLKRQLRDKVGMFFTVALPAFLFFVFGIGDRRAYGSANVAMYVMVSMAAYGAVTATTTVARGGGNRADDGMGPADLR